MRSVPQALESLEPRRLLAATFFVSTLGSDANPGTAPDLAWRTVQHAFNAATPGSTVNVLKGRYREKPTLNVSGNETDGFITFQAAGKVVLSGRGVPGANIISINNRSYVRIIGFDIRDNLRVNDGSGIRISEANDRIEIRNNKVSNIRGRNAMGITVYGTEPTRGISNLVIDGNEVFRCQSAPSEAIVLNGNVYGFLVTNNYVHDVNNIGIDFIGGEGVSPDPATDVTRDGLVAGNRVTRARFKFGGRDAAGIYVDGARNIVVERNVLWRNDVGIEVNAIQPQMVATGIVVRNNFVANNNRAGIWVGGSDPLTGSVQNSLITGNTVVRNDLQRSGNGEIRLSVASNIRVVNNIVVGRRGTALLNESGLAQANTSNYNLFFSPGGPGAALFAWGGIARRGLDAHRAARLQEPNSLFTDPLLQKRGGPNLRLRPGSPAINAGDPAFAAAPGEADVDGQARVQGARVDLGADEAA